MEIEIAPKTHNHPEMFLLMYEGTILASSWSKKLIETTKEEMMNI